MRTGTCADTPTLQRVGSPHRRGKGYGPHNLPPVSGHRDGHRELLDMLVQSRPDWTSQRWSDQFRGTLLKAINDSDVQEWTGEVCKILRSHCTYPPPCAGEPVVFICGREAQAPLNKTYMSAVWHMQIRAGFPDPFGATVQMPRLDYVIRGIKRQETERGGNSRERLPITPHILCRLWEVWAPDGHLYGTPSWCGRQQPCVSLCF